MKFRRQVDFQWVAEQETPEGVEWCFQKGTRPTEEQIQVWNGYMSNRGWSDGLSAFVVGPHLPLVKKKTPASGPVAAVYDCRRLLLDLPLWRLSMTADENDRIMDDRIFFLWVQKTAKPHLVL